jgi:hypothetical protein
MEQVPGVHRCRQTDVVHSDPGSWAAPVLRVRGCPSGPCSTIRGGETPEFLRQFPSVRRDQAYAALKSPRRGQHICASCLTEPPPTWRTTHGHATVCAWWKDYERRTAPPRRRSLTHLSRIVTSSLNSLSPGSVRDCACTGRIEPMLQLRPCQHGRPEHH